MESEVRKGTTRRTKYRTVARPTAYDWGRDVLAIQQGREEEQ